MSSFSNDCRDGDYLDITDLVRHVASECLSLSHPFTPLSKAPRTATSSLSPSAKNSQECDDALTDGTLLQSLHVQGRASLDAVLEKTTNFIGSSIDSRFAIEHNDTQYSRQRIVPTKLPQLNLLDAMSALELGDKRMDCCEIPVVPLAQAEYSTNSDETNGSTVAQNAQPMDSSPLITFPPRIAPTSLSDGVPICAFLLDKNNYYINNTNSTSSSTSTSASALFVPNPPCPSLLPHWNNLRMSSTSLLPLILLQLTALEAYVGTNNGGSTAAETLYCMLWFHDGVLLDMAERLGVNDTNATLLKYENDAKQRQQSTCDKLSHDELNVARWILFASSLGVVRIAEAVRLVVVSADFYEEEDFGVTLHGEKTMEDQISGGAPKGVSTIRFCPALQGSQYCEIVWKTALSRIRSYRSSCTVSKLGEVNSTIDALETIICLQQSFYQAVHILSNLSGNTVRDFAKLAIKRSQETVNLLGKLRANDTVTEISKIGLVGLNGQLQTSSDQSQLMSASFDPFVNRRLLGNAPVRKACFRNMFDVTASLSCLAAELEWGVCDPILHGSSFARITTMLENNSLRGGGAAPLLAQETEIKGDKEMEGPVGMNILSRSLIVQNLYFEDKLFGQHDFAYLVAQHMRQCAVPDLLLVSTDLLSIMVKPMYETLKALCLNRHRERVYIETILLPAFEVLQYESTVVDEKFKIDRGLDIERTPSFATNYVILNTIRLMERHLGLGIELGLFPNWWDMHTALWYRDFLLSALINVKGVIGEEMLHEGDDTRPERQLQQQRKKKPKSKKGKQSKQQTTSSQDASIPAGAEFSDQPNTDNFNDRLQYTSLLVKRNLCRGLVQYMSALRQANLLPDPPTSIETFTSHQKRFEKRFEAFRAIPHPPCLTYDDYVNGSNFSAVASNDLLASATTCFRSAKGEADWLLGAIAVEGGDSPADFYIPIRKENLQLAKVCVHNILFFQSLDCRDHPSDSNTNVRLEFNTHKQFCTLSFT